MKKLKRLLEKHIQLVSDKVSGGGLMQEENTAEGARYITPGMPELIRRSGAEGIVLLKNERETLPLKEADVVSVFGRCQNDWFYVGYGSGGDVHPPYRVSLMDGLRNGGIACNEALAKAYQAWCSHPDHEATQGWWGHWPFFHEEMPLTEKQVSEAAQASNVALVVIGRAAGEDRENTLTEGSFYLTRTEREMLTLVCGAFERVVVIMNCGSVMDLSFVQEYSISSLLFVWQLGQESGNAVADVLSGRENPSGKLTDTVAFRYEDYPSSPYFGNRKFNYYTEDIFVGYRYFSTFQKEVLYPFGFGLSYTDFEMETVGAFRNGGKTTLRIKVTNTGRDPGKEVVQVYCGPPAGKLDKPRKVLVGFQKTGLLGAGESETVTVCVRDLDCASYDDSGDTGFQDAFVLEEGTYDLLVGNCSTTESIAFSFDVPQTQKLCQCREACIPGAAFPVMTKSGMKQAAAGKRCLKGRILRDLPKEIPYTADLGIDLSDVAAGKYTLEQFVAQLSDRELSDLTRGEGGMRSALGVAGNTGAFGGITEELRAKGIPAIITADGPAGLRVKKFTALMPCGTALACTWNTELVEQLFQKEGEEAAYFGVDVLLAPGMNIHRNPLCGRNFEYYSEDPLLTGKIAAAAVRGIQKGGVSACPKHFACNNQEVNRNRNDSRVSQRALREIYLKGFEICVKESAPQNLMTSYNKINGVWSHYNYDLATTVLRGEWNYQGNIVTDWWMQRCASPEFPQVKNNAYRVRAQVDVLMPGGLSRKESKYVFDKKMLATLGKKGGITRGELQRSAMNVLRFALIRMQKNKCL